MGLALAACRSPEGPAAVAPPPVPAAIAVDDPSLYALLRVRGRGVQVYRCEAGRTSAPPFSWTLVGPDAQLLDDAGAVVGKHSAGPTWELGDGSKITAAVQAKAVVDPGAIPWLRLEVATSRGAGALAKATRVQRLETTGGLAPATDCDASTEGHEARVDYTATYVFWGPR